MSQANSTTISTAEHGNVFVAAFDWCLRGLGNKWRQSPWWLPGGLADSQLALLYVLSAAHRDRIDVLPLLDGLAQEHRRSSKWRFKRLAGKIRSGATAIDALEQTPDILRDHEVSTLRLAQQAGILNEAYDDLIEARDGESATRVFWRRYLIYAVAVLLTTLLASAFLATIIAPTLREIIEELGLEPTTVQSSFYWFANFGVFSSLAILMPIAFVGFFVFAIRVPMQAFVRRRIFRPLTPGGKSERATELFSMLSLVLRNGRPIESAVSTLAKYHYHPETRRKLLFVRNEMEQGVASWDGLQSVGLTDRGPSQSLQSCETAREQGWLLRQMVVWRRLKSRHQRNLLSAVAGPMAIVACGALVFWNVLSVLSVLLKLTLSLA